ncbi:ankyrin repeat domain-containing protein [Sphingomonas hengshuiensis]|uniref:Ankyrin n=1 Tax=Sphingomonas hengshuiensis TaxID=1609977 RepID=A0A7U5BG75_9SPHN|nr:ankyrin repeat domain-containing protein [Sphingomonas hengshuiensis]AJP74677.1 ankyrin [Sphingomonas hengshuiensis]
MVLRAFRLAAAAALVFSATPAFAQKFSDGYEFLEAVRKADGTKVNKFLQDKSLRIVNTKDRRNGQGALHIVAERRDQVYLRALLQADDANPNIQDREGNTPLIVAVNQSWAEGVSILMKYRANINLPNAAGESPLIRAVLIHDANIVRMLLDAGANPDRGDYRTGKTARDYAAQETRFPAIARLLANAPKGGAGGTAAAGPKL